MLEGVWGKGNPLALFGEGNGTPLQYSWKIPWSEEPGGLQSMGSLRVETRLSHFTFTFHVHALKKEMATFPVFLPGESQGQGSLVGCHLWGCTDSATTETTYHQQQQLALLVGIKIDTVTMKNSMEIS